MRSPGLDTCEYYDSILFLWKRGPFSFAREIFEALLRFFVPWFIFFPDSVFFSWSVVSGRCRYCDPSSLIRYSVETLVREPLDLEFFELWVFFYYLLILVKNIYIFVWFLRFFVFLFLSSCGFWNVLVELNEKWKWTMWMGNWKQYRNFLSCSLAWVWSLNQNKDDTFWWIFVVLVVIGENWCCAR